MSGNNNEELSGVTNNNLGRKKIEFTNEERNGILQFLLQKTLAGKLQNGAIKSDAREFNCNRNTIGLIWKRAQQSYATGKRCANVDSRKKKNCGRKKKDFSENLERMRAVPFNKRSNFRSLSYAIGIPKTTLFRIFKRGEFKRESNVVKPYLTDQNKKQRVEFCLSKIHPDGKFLDLFDHIHIDEKWFYMTRVKRNFYLCLDEEVLQKNHHTENVKASVLSRKSCF